MKSLRIGTRKSPLAMWQAKNCVARLKCYHPHLEPEIVPVSTTGDRTKGQLCDVGGKGLFSKEIHEALIRGDIDCAVHSLKDLESVNSEDSPQQSSYLDSRIRIGAVWRAGSSQDVLVYRKQPCPWVASDSQRRKDQLKLLMPSVQFVSARGNVETRLKLVQGDVDGTVLALAGLERLGFWKKGSKLEPPYDHFSILFLTEMVPAAGQGVLAVDALDDRVLAIISQAHDEQCWQHHFLERRVLQLMQANCHTSIGLESSSKGVRWFYKGKFGFYHHAGDVELTASLLAQHLQSIA